MECSTPPLKDDVLKELDRTDLSNILSELKTYSPKHIRPYNYVYNYLLHFDRINEDRSKIYSGRWNVKFFGHRRGSRGNCTFVTIPQKDDYCITVFSLEETASELIECLVETQLIDWNHTPFSLAVDQQHFNVVNEILKNIGDGWKYEPSEFIMYMEMEKIMKLPTPVLPVTIYVESLNSKYAKLINDRWAYKYEGSEKLIKQSIELNGGTALFIKGIKDPIAWIGTNDFFTPGFLHTIEAERRKGYATAVFTHELKRLVKLHNLDIFTYVVSTNRASIQMHRRLGFKAVNSIIWIVK